MFTYIKSSLDGLLKQWYYIIPYYIIFPMLIALLLGKFCYSDSHFKSITNKIPIIIVDYDQSQSSKDLINYLSHEYENKTYEIISSKKDAKIEISIPKGYEKSIKNNINFNLEILILSTSDIGTLDNLLQSEINKYHELIAINKSLIDSENTINTIYKESSIVSNNISYDNALNSYKHFSFSISGFLGVLLILLFINSSFVADESGLSDRLHSLPLSKSRLFHYDLITMYIIIFTFKLTYTMFFRVIGVSFTGNILILMGILLIDTFYICSLTLILSSIFKKSTGTLVCFLLPIIQSFGGTFFYTSPVLKYTLLTPIDELYKHYLLYNNINELINPIIIALIIAIPLYLISLFKNLYYWRFKI